MVLDSEFRCQSCVLNTYIEYDFVGKNGVFQPKSGLYAAEIWEKSRRMESFW